jgi:hypothetical protein
VIRERPQEQKNSPLVCRRPSATSAVDMILRSMGTYVQ